MNEYISPSYFTEIQKLKDNQNKNNINLYNFSYSARLKTTKSLGKSEQKQKKEVIEEVRSYLVESKNDLIAEAFMNPQKRKEVHKTIQSYLLKNNIVIPGLEGDLLLDHVTDEIVGFGICQPLIDDTDVTDIFINGQKDIRYRKNGKDLVFEHKYDNEEELKNLAYKLANGSGAILNRSRPSCDCSFPYLRINISLGDIAGLGTTITIRKHSPFLRATEKRIIETNQATKEMLNFLEAAVVGGLNILITGSTGSGKTEFIRYLAGYIPDDDRTLVAEDDRELYLERLYPEKHIYSMNCRITEDEETSIDYSDILKNALRQFPRRIIVGESRGEEAIQVLEFLQTDHPGMTSIHSRGIEQAFDRLVQMCLGSKKNIGADALYRQIGNTFDLVIRLALEDDGNRYVTEISEVGYENGNIITNYLYRFIKTHEERDNNGKIVKIHGKHVRENKLSEKLFSRLSSSVFNTRLYKDLIPDTRRMVN